MATSKSQAQGMRDPVLEERLEMVRCSIERVIAAKTQMNGVIFSNEVADATFEIVAEEYRSLGWEVIIRDGVGLNRGMRIISLT